ncbi:SMP-30/gluconolactonase/LRE family protein [Streptomyces sp. NPDC017638]|uniref:SMP-30/gluconolactonase/LRE family protein n=1 Tax=Streptomyces sp. NPDC017638 TaxID=3365004 RepID=UPI0037A6BBCE
MPRRPRLTGAATAALALGLVAAAPATGTEPPVGDARVVARFDPAAGRTPENIALEPDGSADLTFAAARTVAHVTLDGTTTTRATLPAVADPATPLVRRAVVTGIARAHDGTLYVNYATGTRATGVWRLSPGAAPARIAALPPDGFPNGLALDERRGVLYAADSVRGTVWRVPAAGGPATTWARRTELRPSRAGSFGANGIEVHRGAVWVSNTDRGTLVRLPVRENGSAGAPETLARGLAGIDGFAFPGAGRTALAALNGGNQVVLVRRDGSHTVVLTEADGLAGPTSVAVRGRAVYVPSAAYRAGHGPNLLLARLRYHFGRL